MLLTPFKIKVVSQRVLTPRVIQLTFAPSDGHVFSFIAGQFVTFLLPHEQGGVVRRSYSIANSPGQGTVIEIAVAFIEGGFATHLLFNLKIDDELLCIGPRGNLCLTAENGPFHYLLVATGTGVAPYRAMLSTIAKKLIQDDRITATLLLGVRYAEDLLYKEDFIAFAQQYDRFYFRAYLSRTMSLSEHYHYAGYVQSAFDTLPLNPARDMVYLCGNPHMIDDSLAKLQQLGFPAQHIKREKYFPSKNGLKKDKGNTCLS